MYANYIVACVLLALIIKIFIFILEYNDLGLLTYTLEFILNLEILIIFIVDLNKFKYFVLFTLCYNSVGCMIKLLGKCGKTLKKK